ncbi:metallophosphoesterase [Helicobacter sp. 23-1044]
MLEIQNDAIFIADSHTQISAQNTRDSLILALQKMCDSHHAPSQIFLLGDISNILVGNLKSSVKSNETLLNAIDSLSKKAQVIYFAGNHDFNLEGILPNVRKIPRKNQPLLAKFGKKCVLIAHGDIFLDKKYEIYIKILSAKITGKILQIADFATFGWLYRFIEKKVQNKKIRFLRGDSAIYELIRRRIKCYQTYAKSQNLNIDLIIEGHFHLGKIVDFTLDSANNADFATSQNLADSALKYIALPAFLQENSAFKIDKCEFITL